MDESGTPGRRAAGRHAAGRHAAGRARRDRRRGLHGRRRTRGRGLLVGTIVLAGAAAVLGANGTIGGVLTAATTAGRPAAAEAPPALPSSGAQRGNGPSALPGKAGAEAHADAGARARSREVRRPAPPKATGGGVAPEAGPGAASPEAAEPGLVSGTTDPDDLLAGGPEPGDVAGYRADGPSRHTDREAAEFFRTRWGADDKALKRLKDIRTVGGYLRIYTDLPESADNSATALTLCRRGLDYLRARGVARPVVFVQAGFGENGNPVLANILGPADTSCRVTHPAPG
ncbi:hypothetical protein E1292_24320 [Nonomuraea deserti]|uniref:Uncharacterized protein n=1 Tax=Nonomuraea deserti TaxID=1848322 RepID=A0A4R4VPW1_9ACTN|nr:hypothetical protein [Nonomuraea deserti]TDD02140.1 hypothetical protein E1292_24320 [Nonomuraea deserti]